MQTEEIPKVYLDLEDVKEVFDSLPSIGFKDLTYGQHIVFEYIDQNSSTHYLLSTNGQEWCLSDGRPTVDKFYHHGKIDSVQHLIQLMIANCGNLKSVSADD